MDGGRGHAVSMSAPSLPEARIIRCNLELREREPDPEPEVRVGTLLLVGIPLLAFMCALVVPALHL